MMNFIWKLRNYDTGEIVEHNFVFSTEREARQSAKRYASYRGWKSFKAEIIPITVVAHESR